MKNDFDHLIATKQYFPAVWRVIDGGRDDADTETVRKVSEVVGMAIKDNCAEQLGKIMKQFERWIDPDTRLSAYACLNETTAVDPLPDEL